MGMISILRYPEIARYEGIKVDIAASITTFLQKNLFF